MDDTNTNPVDPAVDPVDGELEEGVEIFPSASESDPDSEVSESSDEIAE